MTVKEIQETCKWNAYKIHHNSYLNGVHKFDYSFSNRKKVHFGKEWVFLAEFDIKKTRNEVIKRSIEVEGMEGAWRIYGKQGRFKNKAWIFLL